ncbi:hypothetical protein QBC37DRAFT_296633 [Rhypophila decipiens]|uniref:NAD(P)-binding domain-containing protein n=1 Tax=Rhypophila decipiens TaxID=261697 RepID=A0AAN6XXN9_9PEZI|nr:hypothetical protein QBC37DRAFT_296633 [Rhypophila decipiens]
MQVTVLPACARTSQATIRALLAHPSSPSVKGIYRDPSKAPEEFTSSPRFEALKGDMQDSASLEVGLERSDAVVVTIPPVRDPTIDIIANAARMAGNVKTAVNKTAAVKKLVMVSTKGAQYDHGLGEVLSTLHKAEKILVDTNCESITFLRCAYFMENWASSIPMVKGDPSFFFSTITPLDWAMPMVATKDIGAACANAALSDSSEASKSKVKAVELHGPKPYSALDVKKAFEEVIGGGKDVQVRPIEREALVEFFGQVFRHPTVAKWFGEMMMAATPGGIMVEDPEPTEDYLYGKTGLVDMLRSMW